MNVFMVRDGVVVTPPVTENILEGITRRSVIELLQQELGMQVVERPIDRTEIYICDEFFITGTAAEVTAVTRVDYRPIGSGKMGLSRLSCARYLRMSFMVAIRNTSIGTCRSTLKSRD